MCIRDRIDSVKAELYLVALGYNLRKYITKIMRIRIAAVSYTHLKGWILDGFPRTTAQASALDAILHDLGIQLTAVLDFNVKRCIRDRA